MPIEQESFETGGYDETQVSSDEFSSADTNRLTFEQRSVINLSKKIARLAVQELGGEIVEDYVSGLSKSEIVAQREIKERYGLTSDAVAGRVVYEVICVLM